MHRRLLRYGDGQLVSVDKQMAAVCFVTYSKMDVVFWIFSKVIDGPVADVPFLGRCMQYK